MSLDKITLIRDGTQEGAKASKLLKDSKIKFIEVFGYSDRGPSLFIPNQAYARRGYRQIIEYIESIKTK